MPSLRLACFREELAAVCQDCGRDPATIRLVAVTKAWEPAVLPLLAAEGQLVYGENRVEHLRTMHAAAPAGASFHFIGRLQSRQFKHFVPLVDCLHSLDRVDHVARLDRCCREADRRLEVFCQVNTSGEPQKAGCHPDELADLLAAVRASERLLLLGLMCMAPDLGLAAVDADRVRACFEAARDLAARHGCSRLSMGMSDDWPLAVAAGATDLRIGSALVA